MSVPLSIEGAMNVVLYERKKATGMPVAHPSCEDRTANGTAESPISPPRNADVELYALIVLSNGPTTWGDLYREIDLPDLTSKQRKFTLWAALQNLQADGYIVRKTNEIRATVAGRIFLENSVDIGENRLYE